MPTRSVKTEKEYSEFRKSNQSNGVCTFCELKSGDDQFVVESKSFKIIKNLFPYSQWDSQGVVNHLMLVPKKHTDSISEFSAHEAIEYIDLLSSYERLGYDYSARAPKSNRKTVSHHHTHLIKLDRKSKKFLFYLRKPYLRFTR